MEHEHEREREHYYQLRHRMNANARKGNNRPDYCQKSLLCDWNIVLYFYSLFSLFSSFSSYFCRQTVFRGSHAPPLICDIFDYVIEMLRMHPKSEQSPHPAQNIQKESLSDYSQHNHAVEIRFINVEYKRNIIISNLTLLKL